MPTLAFSLAWQLNIEATMAQEAAQDAILTELAAQLVLIEGAQDDLAAQLILIEAAQRDIARITSYPAPTNVLTAADVGATATISVAAHTRIYPGTVADVAIGASSLTGLPFSTAYAVYYDDATLADTTPTFIATTSIETAQVGADPARHFVGYIMTPADGGGGTGGSGPTPPGGGGGNPIP